MIGPLALLVCLAGPGAEIRAALAAADQARSAAAREASAWQAEVQRTEALIGTLTREAARLNAQAQRDEARIETLQAAVARQEAAAEGATRAAEARHLATSIMRRLAALDLALAPALPSLPTDPAEALEAARTALTERERAARAVEVTITQGHLDGAPRAVQVLRMGHVGLWWRGLDGATAGTARWAEGALHLTAAPDAEAAAIATAVAVAAEQRPPIVVHLPIDQLRGATP